MDCLVSDNVPIGCTVEQLWDWSTQWGEARFIHFAALELSSVEGVFLTAVNQWVLFCDVVYHGQQGDKYRVNVPKVVAFINHWTGKDRARPLFGPFSTYAADLHWHGPHAPDVPARGRLDEPAGAARC